MLNCRFIHFDPVDGILSARLGTRLFEPLYLARQLLSDRKAEDVPAIAQVLEHVWRQPGFRFPRPTEDAIPSMKVALESGEIIDAWPCADEVAVLAANIDHLDLDGVAAPGQLKPHELFAVLALSYIEQACSEEQRFLDDAAPVELRPTESLLAEHVDHYAYAALRAVSIGARHRTEQEKRRASASRGGQARRATAKPLEKAVLGLYEARFTAKSNREAARLILKELQHTGRITFENETRLLFDGEPVLSTDDPQKRFEKWIGAHRKLIAS